MTEGESIIEEEVGVLEAIYIHELEVTRNEKKEVTEMILQLHPSTGDNLEQQYVCMTLVLGIPSMYPEEPPNIEIKNPRGIGEEEVQSTLEAMLALSEERKGDAMLYELIELAKESLTEGNLPRCACMICLEHFVEGDQFRKTSCYHYFHDVCLGRYVKHVLQSQEREEHVAHAKVEAKKTMCPICREDIHYSEDSFPETPVEEKIIYYPSEEMKLQQTKMAAMLERQRQRGGLIDLEAERNKFLIKEDDVVYLNPPPNQSLKTSDQPGENGYKNEEHGKGDGKTKRGGSGIARLKGHDSKFMDSSQSGIKPPGDFRDRKERGWRPHGGGRRRKPNDYDDYRNEVHMARYRDDDDDDYDDVRQRDRRYKNEQHKTNRSDNSYERSQSKNKTTERKKQQSNEERGVNERESRINNSKTDSKDESATPSKSKSQYDHRQNRYKDKMYDDYDTHKLHRFERNRNFDSKSEHFISSKHDKKRPYSSNERSTIDVDGMSEKSMNNRRQFSKIQTSKGSELVNIESSESANTVEREILTDMSKVSTSKDDSEKCHGSVENNRERKWDRSEKRQSNQNQKDERYINNHKRSDRPYSRHGYGRGRARQANREENPKQLDKGIRTDCDNNSFKPSDSFYSLSDKSRTGSENSLINSDQKEQSSRQTDSSKLDIGKQQSVGKSRHKQSTQDLSKPDKPRPDEIGNEKVNRSSVEIYNNSDSGSQISKQGESNKNRKPNNEIQQCFEKRNHKGRGRGREFYKKKESGETCVTDHDKWNNNDVVDRFKDLTIDRETKKAISTKRDTDCPVETNVSQATDKSASNASTPPGFCVKPPPGF